jgi:YD repeat-containing protein
VVLGVVDIASGLAALDLDGDGVAETDDALLAAGISASERAELAALYAPGQTLWRAPITHFTPWDCNWPYGPPDGAEFPDDDFLRDPNSERPCTRSGSVIQCERQSLGQLVDVPGTAVTLAYHGHRKRGWHAEHSLDLQLTDASLPASVKDIALEVEIAGQRHEQRFAPGAGLTTSFSWDGRDAYGRRVQGLQRARARVGYSYDGVYGNAPRFGNRGTGIVTGVASRVEVTLWREASVSVGIWDAQPQGLGGFGIASHHAYDPESKTLLLGDGTRRSARNVATVLTLAGTMDVSPADTHVLAIEAAPSGDIYVATELSVQRIARSGVVTVRADFIYRPSYLALASAGTLSVWDTRAWHVLALAPDGGRTVVAGGGSVKFTDLNGASIPATDVAMVEPMGLALSADGNLYIADRGRDRVYHVDPGGMLTGVSGLPSPCNIDIGPDGSLYISQFPGAALRRLYPDGRIEVVIRSNPSMAPFAVAAREDGVLFVADAISDRVVRIAPDGTQGIVAGGGSREASHGGISTDIDLFALERIGFDAEGAVLVAQGPHVYRVASAVPGVSTDHIAVPSRDGDELYVFDQAGRHHETRDALTGVMLLGFEYDVHGRVIAMTDRDGLTTHIERDARGLARAIVGPYGQRSALDYDAHEQLARIRDPLQRETAFGYDQAGRLTSMCDARDGLHRYEYDERGRLKSDIGPTGY